MDNDDKRFLVALGIFVTLTVTGVLTFALITHTHELIIALLIIIGLTAFLGIVIASSWYIAGKIVKVKDEE